MLRYRFMQSIQPLTKSITNHKQHHIGAQMLFLPECLGFMGDNAEHTLQNADPPIINGYAKQNEWW